LQIVIRRCRRQVANTLHYTGGHKSIQTSPSVHERLGFRTSIWAI